MSKHDDAQTVQMLDDALRAADAPGHTRRGLLERAAVGAAGVAAGAALAPAASVAASGGDSSLAAFGRVAATTEALTVVLVAELVRRINQHPEVPAAGKAIVEGAYAAEVDHLRFTSKHWRPTTTTFWIPDGFFGGPGNALDLSAVGHALVAGETLFVNLYLIGVTAFARAGQHTFARYAAELAGCEAEHRVLAQTFIGATPPDDVGFEVYSIHQPDGIEHALEQAGVGFGAHGAGPGAFYKLAHPITPPPLKIRSNSPR
jgi:hypothetical protein